MSSEVATAADSARADRSWGRTAVLVVTAWLLIVAVVVAVGWLITHPFESSVGPPDNDLARWFADQRTSSLDGVADIGTLLGETVVSLLAAPLVAIAFAIWTRSIVPAIFVALATAGLGGIYFVASTVDPRPRPPVKILDPGLVPTHSFPSGHVGTATALYGCVVVLTWTYARAARWWVTPLLALPVWVLLARLYQGAHHLTDVLTSLLYATAWLATLTVLVLHLHRSRRSEAGRASARSGVMSPAEQ